MEEERFAAALDAAEYDMGCKGIGTLHEKTLHIALKHFFAPDPSCHERQIGGMIADAVTEDGVIEIQTRNLSRLREKLRVFLSICPVTVVHPIANPKWLLTVDENGVLLSKRKSPKHETIFTAIREIYTLREFIGDTRFRLCICEMELAEYRYRANNQKRYTEKLDRVPLKLKQIQYFTSPADYLSLLPAHRSEPFTAKEIAALANVNPSDMRMLLSILERLGAAEQTGKRGRAVLWQTAELFRTVSDSTGG